MSYAFTDKRVMAGLANIVASSFMGLYGYRQSRYGATEAIRAGGTGLIKDAAFNMVGASILSLFGGQSVEQQTVKVEQKLMHFLQQQGVSLEAGDAQKGKAYANRSLGQVTVDFLNRHPTEVTNAYYALLTPFMAQSGLAKLQSKTEKLTGAGELASASLVLSGCLAAIAFKEKTPQQLKRDHQDTRETLAQKALYGIRRRPLLPGAIAGEISNSLQFASGLQEYWQHKKASENTLQSEKLSSNGLYKMVYSSIFLVQNILMGAASKKAHGEPEEFKQAQRQLLEKANAIIALHPPALQEQLAYETSLYLVSLHELRLKDSTAADLTQRLLGQLPSKHQATSLLQTNMLPTASLGR